MKKIISVFAIFILFAQQSHAQTSTDTRLVHSTRIGGNTFFEQKDSTTGATVKVWTEKDIDGQREFKDALELLFKVETGTTMDNILFIIHLQNGDCHDYGDYNESFQCLLRRANRILKK